MAEETVVQEEKGFLDRVGDFAGDAWDALTGNDEPVIAPEDAVEQTIGALTIPPILPGAQGLEAGQKSALGEGLGGMAVLGGAFGQEVPAFAAEGLGYSPGQIDLIDDLARRYDGLNVEKLQSLLVGLAADDTLRDSVMDSLMANDQQLAHYAVQAFEANDGLQDQFEDLVRNNPDAVREMLPALEEDPSKFTELVTAAARTPEEAQAANEAAAQAAAEASKNSMMTVLRDIFTGDTSFSQLLGPQIGGMLDSFLGPIMGMFAGMLDSVKGYVSQNIDPNGPMADFMEQAGVPRSAVFDAAATEPGTTPAPTPEVNNTNTTDPTRTAPSTLTPGAPG